MRRFLSFFLVLMCYGLSRLFYRHELKWVGETGEQNFDDISLMLLLNHTSLFEPLFIGAFPLSFLWHASREAVVPGADKTLSRPIVGLFWRCFAPQMISVSRRRDHTWEKFMSTVKAGRLVVMAPEGRMLRPNGLDAQGKEHTIKGGVADVLKEMKGGHILIAYSGGLHHVQRPGEFRLRLFQTLKMNLELIDLDTYKARFERAHFKRDMLKDLEARKRRYVPGADHEKPSDPRP